MRNVDQEWRDLTERYEKMSDEELQILANDAYDLTDMARGILQNEIALRKLKIKLATEPAATSPAKEPLARHAMRPIAEGEALEDDDDNNFDPEDLDLITLQNVWAMEDARRVKGILDNAGVPSYYGPDNAEDVETLSPVFTAAAAKAVTRGYEVGIEVRVPVRYRDQAFAAMGNWTADHREDPDPAADADYAAQCPKCHSPEIVFEGLDGSASDSADAAFKWRCDDCNNTWSDDGVEERQSRSQ